MIIVPKMGSSGFLVVAAVVASAMFGMVTAQLQIGYYDNLGCTGVEEQARSTFRRNFATDPTASAAMLRVAFHDCQAGPGGCDASIMLEGASNEMQSANNFGVHRLDIIDSVKSDMEDMCPNTVSCADIIALAGREAILYENGPEIQIPLGRKDADFTTEAAADSLPPADISVTKMLSLFSTFGMTTEESVAIMGAHTLGVGHCKSIQNRLSGSDPSLGFVFNAQLQTTCAVNVFDVAVIPMDNTQFTFDNVYYQNVQNGRGLLTIDSLISQDPRTAPIINNFATNQGTFFDAFRSAYVKMTSRAFTGNQGVVNAKCH